MKIKNKRIMTTLMSMLLIFIALFSSSMQTSADSNPASWILCKFEDGKVAYNAVATDLIPFTFRSKSALSSTEDVNGSLLNGMLGLAGNDFDEVNKHILGRELNPSSIPEIDLKEANANAPKVNAFDRFGVSGLKWSSYLGEWKYYKIDACSSSAQVSKTNYGQFYAGRQEPKSSFDDTATSSDPRSMQFNKGLFASWGTAISDTIANGLFFIAKLIVTFTITIVGLSFGDITSVIGLTSSGSAGTTAEGIFTSLFNSVFTSFVLISFTLTALYIIYQGLIKRQFRLALNTIIKTVLIFMIAIIMSTNPAYWIGVPNKVANAGQSLVLNSVASMNAGKSSALCTTDVGKINLKDKNTTDFERINREMQSAIGCKMWSEMLFKPWVRGQFGVEYEELEASKLNNINKEWVGDAAVPVGGGEYINNWALFHLSTQTNAHAPIDGTLPTQVTGVNSDWWRVVDALSNYHEEKVTSTPDGGVGSVTYDEQVKAEPLDMWQSWIGNNSTQRMGVALTSIIFSVIGSLGPLVMGFTSVVLGVGITILMMMSPVFLLFGTWGGRGQEIFNGWLSALVSTVYKKVIASVLLVISITLTIAGLELVNTVGVLKSMVLVAILSLVLVKNKKHILNTLGNIDFGGAFNPISGFNRTLDNINQRAKRTSSVALASAAGAKTAKEIGMTATEGAKVAGFHQLRNVMYQTQFGMNVTREYDNTLRQGQYSANERICIACGRKIGENDAIAFRDEYGNFLCRDCGEESSSENLYEVVIDNENLKKRNRTRFELEEAQRLENRETRRVDATMNSSWMSHSYMRDQMNIVAIGDNTYWDNSQVEGMIKLNIKRLYEDQAVFEYNYEQIGKAARPPAIPEPLQNYLDAPLISEAWTQQNYDFINKAYTEAWAMWYEDNGSHIANLSDQRRSEFIKEIKTYKPKVEGTKAIDKFIEKNGHITKDYDNPEEDLFIYSDEELISPNDPGWAAARVAFLKKSADEQAELKNKAKKLIDENKTKGDTKDSKKPKLNYRE